MNLSFTQRHRERQMRLDSPTFGKEQAMRMKEKSSVVLSDIVDIDEKWGVAHVPAPPSKCSHVWVPTSTQHTTCGKCRAKARWNNELLTFTPTGE